jgi:hypothetical protein
MLGNEVIILVNNYLIADYYEIEFGVSDLPSGF